MPCCSDECLYTYINGYVNVCLLAKLLIKYTQNVKKALNAYKMLKDHRYKAKSISLIFLNSHTNESFTFILFSFSRRQVWYSLVIFSFEEWTCEHMCVCLRSATHKQSSRPQSCNYPKLRQSVRYHNPPFSVTETRRSSQICTADLSLKPTHLTFIRHFMNGTGVKFQGLTKRYLFVHFSPLTGLTLTVPMSG